MIDLESKPKNMNQKEKQQQLPSDQKILRTLYKHYGKPDNIVKEKVKLYKKYTTPAGMSMGDWKEGDFQLGRVTIFTGYKEHPDDMYEATCIQEEGVGSWFIGVSPTTMKVWVGGKLDQILEIS